MSNFVDLLSPEYLAAFNARQQGEVDAVPTPFPAWNEYSGDDGGGEGLARGWFVTIGGNPKQGKSLLALSLTHRALKNGERVGFMSLEMSDPQLAGRFYAMVGQVPIRKLEKGRRYDTSTFEEAQLRVRSIAVSNRGQPALFVNEDPIFALDLLLEHMKVLHEDGGCRWFVVDYLQLVSMGDDEDAVRTVTKAVKELRRFAITSESVVIGLSQFKRSVSENYHESPRIQGLFGGGAIEQVSDQIVLLDHSRSDYDAENKITRTWLMLTNRHGQHGDIPILWNYHDLTVREGLEDEVGEWPKKGNSRK